MCGIVGIVHRDQERPVPGSAIERMCDAIRHRGPDDQGAFTGENAGLGMRRLSIIDLAGGHQPIFNEDQSRVIVFNGEIYNYRELRPQLISRGHRLQTQSDTECILHLHEDLGSNCVQRLRGMFTFAIWNRTERELFLARDRFGIKPMYYVERPWGLAFASELKALLSIGASAGRLDWPALDAFFQLGYIPAPSSPFEDIRKLPPGCTLTWSARAGARIEQYWDLPRERKPAPPDVAERVLEWLDDSVASHLVSDVPVAAFLSGGLDSSAVVSSMALANGTPHAFTARYHGSGAEATDETGLARELADRYGAKLSIIDVRPEVGAILEPIIWALDEPLADESAIPTWLISQAVAREYKVALAGTGGDELFAGYRRQAALAFGDWYGRLPGAIKRSASRMADLLPEPSGTGLGLHRMKRFLREGAGDRMARYFGYLTKIPEADRRRLFTPAVAGEADGRLIRGMQERWSPMWGEGAGLSTGLYVDYRVYLPDDILAVSDRISMAHSLEVRVPFVDHELVGQVFPLPDRLKLRRGRGKLLLREALKSRLPAAHFRAPKRGFVGPTGSWLRNELAPMLREELSAGRMARLGYFDPRVVEGFLDDHFSRRQNRSGILWALLSFSIWHRLYVERAAGSPYPG
jgi:asparagine synthase (glutamine-hydrolysing)